MATEDAMIKIGYLMERGPRATGIQYSSSSGRELMSQESNRSIGMAGPKPQRKQFAKKSGLVEFPNLLYQ